jgi:hypothetical protein
VDPDLRIRTLAHNSETGLDCGTGRGVKRPLTVFLRVAPGASVVHTRSGQRPTEQYAQLSGTTCYSLRSRERQLTIELNTAAALGVPSAVQMAGMRARSSSATRAVGAGRCIRFAATAGGTGGPPGPARRAASAARRRNAAAPAPQPRQTGSASVTTGRWPGPDRARPSERMMRSGSSTCDQESVQVGDHDDFPMLDVCEHADLGRSSPTPQAAPNPR